MWRRRKVLIVRFLERFGAAFPGADPNDFRDGVDENFSIADLAGVDGFPNLENDFLGHFRGNRHFHFNLRLEGDGVLSSPVEFGVAFLPPEAANFRNGHSSDADFFQGGAKFFQFMRSNDGFNFIHDI